MPPTALGAWGERVAAEYLERRGWTILDRNYRCGHREIDLVARRDGVVAFVEVKTRAATGFGHPFDAIGPRKRREIERVATAWIDAHPDTRVTYRFDAVAVTRGSRNDPAIEHLPDAWGV